MWVALMWVVLMWVVLVWVVLMWVRVPSATTWADLTGQGSTKPGIRDVQVSVNGTALLLTPLFTTTTSLPAPAPAPAPEPAGFSTTIRTLDVLSGRKSQLITGAAMPAIC